MTDQNIFNIIALSFIALGAVTLLALLFITAPYGRHARKGWGPAINARLGWVLMEFPAPLLMIIFFVYSSRDISPTLVAFLIIWEYHYLYRTFIYPMRLKNSKPVTVSIILLGLIFNTANGYIQGTWIFNLAPEQAYQVSWLYDPRFLAGLALFITGSIINRQSDAILRNLREGTSTGYQVPHGGLYRWISSPNYFGEILEWIGWAILTWSLAGAVFAFWTFANLFPRALSHHRWYRETFDDYPSERKAIIPGII